MFNWVIFFVLINNEKFTFSLSSPASVISWKVNGSPTRTQPQTEKRQTQGFVTESNITIDSNILLSDQNQVNVECIATNNEGPLSSNQHIIRVLCKFNL